MTYREEQLILKRIENLETENKEMKQHINKIHLTLNAAKLGNFPTLINE